MAALHLESKVENLGFSSLENLSLITYHYLIKPKCSLATLGIGNRNNQVLVSTAVDSLYNLTQGRWVWQHDSILVILWCIFSLTTLSFHKLWTSFLQVGDIFVHQRLGFHLWGHMIWQFHLVLCDKVSCRQPVSNKTPKILTFITFITRS